MSRTRLIEQPGISPMTMGALLGQSDSFTSNMSLRPDASPPYGMGELEAVSGVHGLLAAATSWNNFQNQNHSLPPFTDMPTNLRTSLDARTSTPGPSFTCTNGPSVTPPPAVSLHPGTSNPIRHCAARDRGKQCMPSILPTIFLHPHRARGGQTRCTRIAGRGRAVSHLFPTAANTHRHPRAQRLPNAPVLIVSPGVGSARPERRCMFGPQGCAHCPLVDTASRALKEHLEKHHSAQLDHNGDGQYKCHWRLGAGKECDKYLLGVLGLAKHVGRVHLRTGEVWCGFCGAPFCRPNALERHVLKVCKEKPAETRRR